MELGRGLGGKLFLDLGDFTSDDLPPPVLVPEQAAKAFAFPGQFGVFLLDFLFFQLAQLPEPHVQNRLGLHVGQLERLHQLLFRLVLLADDLDDFVQVQIRHQKPVQDFQPVLDLFQPVLGAPDQDIVTVVEEGLKRFTEVHHAGRVVGVQDVQVQWHPGFKLGLPEQLFH